MSVSASAGSASKSRREYQPLGPDSLTWKYFGDLRTGLMGVWIGALQNMHPELGAGVEEHSILLREPLQRVARSVYPIMGVVYDGDRASATGQQVRSFHETIKGTDSAGRRYHALNPETFYWAHATFFMLVLKTAEYFCGGLTEAEKRQLFDEHVQWYRMYGMSMRPVPRTWDEFQDYWDRVCRDELEINRATLDIFQIRIPKPKFVLMPTPVWDQMFKPLVAGQRWIAAGLFDPVVREKAGHAMDARGRDSAAAVRQGGRGGVPGGAGRDPAAPARAGRLQAIRRASCERTRHWWRRRRSWARRATDAACRCTTSRAARRSSSGPVHWCTRRSRSPAFVRRGAAAGRPNPAVALGRSGTGRWPPRRRR